MFTQWYQIDPILDSRSPLDRKRRLGGGGGGAKSGIRRAPADCRVFVSNIPFDMKWQELKVNGI